MNWDYRSWLKESVEEKIKAGADISFSKLATRTKIQRTYLSQVIHKKNHLSNDQLYAIAQALELSNEERQRLILMAEWERCKIESRKEQLAARLGASPSTDQGTTPPEAIDDYFCDPMAEFVLRFLGLQKTPDFIRSRLGLSDARYEEILQTLIQCGFIRREGDALQALRAPMFPPTDSPAERIRNIQGRLKVAHNKLKQRDVDEFMYNWWFIANPERKKTLKIRYLRLLQEIYQESLTTAHENVYQLSIDLFTP